MNQDNQPQTPTPPPYQPADSSSAAVSLPENPDSDNLSQFSWAKTLWQGMRYGLLSFLVWLPAFIYIRLEIAPWSYQNVGASLAASIKTMVVYALLWVALTFLIGWRAKGKLLHPHGYALAAVILGYTGAALSTPYVQLLITKLVGNLPLATLITGALWAIWIPLAYGASFVVTKAFERKQVPAGSAMAAIVVSLLMVCMVIYSVANLMHGSNSRPMVQEKPHVSEDTATVYLPPKNSQWTQAKYINETKGDPYPIYDVFPSDEELGKSDFGSMALTFEHRFASQKLFHENQDGSCKVSDTRQVVGKSCKLVYQDDHMSVYLETLLNWDPRAQKNLYSWYVERGITTMTMSQSAIDAESVSMLARKLEFIKNLKPAYQQDVDKLVKAEEQRRSNK